MIALASALLLASPALAAEDWRVISESDTATTYLDMDSVEERDGKRHFVLKLIAKDNTRYVIARDVVDCAAGTMDTPRMEIWQDGKFLTGDDFPAGKYHYDLTVDAASRKLLGLVCA